MLARINRTYPKLLDEFFGMDVYPVHYSRNGFKSLPAVNITEGDEAYTIEVAAPGLEKKDFRIDLDNDVLTISSERKTGISTPAGSSATKVSAVHSTCLNWLTSKKSMPLIKTGYSL